MDGRERYRNPKKLKKKYANTNQTEPFQYLTGPGMCIGQKGFLCDVRRSRGQIDLDISFMFVCMLVEVRLMLPSAFHTEAQVSPLNPELARSASLANWLFSVIFL